MPDNDLTAHSEASPSRRSETAEGKQPKSTKPRRVIRRRRANARDASNFIDVDLLDRVVRDSGLPSAYNFEILKTLQRIHKVQARHVALQMPEGLLMYATVLADVLKSMAASLSDVSILGDVTYGACCVDDLGARALGADLLVHYGHSCLVPIQHTVVPCLYVFVELRMDERHMVDCVCATLDRAQPLALLGTIQFRQGLVRARELFGDRGYVAQLPQVKPLSPGEVLGCTSPRIDSVQTGIKVVIFCADGRFHLESCMIANPQIEKFLRYDPYGKTLTVESYGHREMRQLRRSAIRQAQVVCGQKGGTFGIVLGTLGRQGNPAILNQIRSLLQRNDKKFFVLLLSEISPAKLDILAPSVDVWVQIACPRLSVDWGHCFGENTIVLSPFELHVALGETEWDGGDGADEEPYPMDYYSNEGGPWSNYNDVNKNRRCSCHDDNGTKGVHSSCCGASSIK